MAFYLYQFDTLTNKPKVSAIDVSTVLLANGTVGLSANWLAGAHQIQVSVDPVNANDLTRKSWVESQLSALQGPFGATNIFSGQANGADPVSVGVGARFLVTAAYSTYVVGDVIEQITLTPTFSKVTLTNSDVYVARVTLPNSETCTSDSSDIDAGEITVWNSGTGKWVTIGSVIALPNATSATKGVVQIDTAAGLDVAAGVIGVNIDTTTLGFNIAGDTGSIYVKASGINHANLSNLNSTTYTHLTQANHTDLTDGGDSTLHYHATDRDRANHTGTQVAATIVDFAEAAQDASASMWTTGSHTAFQVTYQDSNNRINGAVKYDNTTIGVDGSNQLELKNSSVTSVKLGTVIVANEGLKQTTGALGVDYDNVTIGIVANKLATLSTGVIEVPYTNNTGSPLAAGTVVSLSTTVSGEIVKANANDADLADAVGVVKAEILNGATGLVTISGKATVITDGNALSLGKWVYVAGGASAGKASRLYTGSYYQVKLGKAYATDKVHLEHQWIG